MKSLICAMGLSLIATAALADQWIPYTDGRSGGCFLNSSGILYGCTPQRSAETIHDAPKKPGSRSEARVSSFTDQHSSNSVPKQSSSDMALQQYNDRQRALDAWTAAEAETSSENAYRTAYSGCHEPEYSERLKKLHLFRVQGTFICGSTDKKARTAGAFNCPPCN